VLTVARPTITGLLLTLGLTDTDGSAFYRLFSAGRLDYDTLTRRFLPETLVEIPPEKPYVAVMDGTQLPRVSRTMPGTAWLKNPRPTLPAPGDAAAALARLQPGAAAALRAGVPPPGRARRGGAL